MKPTESYKVRKINQSNTTFLEVEQRLVPPYTLEGCRSGDFHPILIQLTCLACTENMDIEEGQCISGLWLI